MLKLVYGPSGSGKTRWILERMAERIGQGQEKLFWVVPEQHSFACERALLQRLGPVQAARVQVLSFSRLADRVFREVGGLAGQPLDEGIRALLMSRALEQVAAVSADQQDPMQGLRPRLVTDSAYVEKLISLWEELRRCAVSTDRLEQVAQALAQEPNGNGLLTEKTQDLYRVFSTYEGLVKSTGLRETDDLTRLAQVLGDSALPVEAAVFVDGFKGFTQQELAVLEQLMLRAGELAVALCTDTLGKNAGARPAQCRREFSLFSPVTATVQRLRELAENHKMTWETVALTENHRAQAPALKALEAGLYAPVPEVFEGPADQVTVVPCESVYAECRYAVRRIRRLMREGYRYREIAVAVRHLADYQGILDDMLTCEGIPYYMDARRELLCEPLVVYLRSALRVAVEGWRTEELLRLLKTDLWPLEALQVAELENYVYTWRIDGAAWEKEWTEHPAGLDVKGGVTQEDKALLARLNRHRQALVDSLGGLRRALRGGVTGRQFAGAVYGWLASQKELPERIARQTQVLEELAQPVLAAHTARLWDEMMKLLDRFAVALGDQRLPVDRLEDLFTMLCRTIDIGTIPQGLDAVQVGSVDRMRFEAPRAVLVLGANEGVLPAYPMGDGLLTEEERRRLKEQSLTLAEDVLTQCVEERYYAYRALTAPSQQLVVTYRKNDETGPSPVVSAIRHILPHHAKDADKHPDGTDLECGDEMFRRWAHSHSEASPLSETLRQVLAADPEQRHRMAAVERSAAAGMNYRLEEEATAEALFGRDMCLSASQADTFYKCKFKYFCQYGLRLKERRVAEIDGGVFGTLVHYAMEALLPRYCQPGGLIEALRANRATQAPDKEALLADVTQVLDEYVEEKLGGFESKDGYFLYQLGLARRSAVNVLWHTLVELQQGRFDPLAFELNIHPEQEQHADGILSLKIPLTKGSVQVRGSVDRLDLYRRTDETGKTTYYVRVVDYKTGDTTFKLYHLTQGQNIQMLLYLFTVCENYRYGTTKEKVQPAGVLYHPVNDLLIKRGEKAASRLKRMKMSGVVLDDADVVKAMEADAKELFIPAKMKPVKESETGEEVVEGNVVTPAQFTLLQNVVEGLLTQMGDDLLAGDIRALPIKDGDSTACTYCDYKAICGHEQEDGFVKLKNAPKSKKFADAMKELEEEVTGRGQKEGMD